MESVRILLVDAFPPEHRALIRAATEDLIQHGQDPSEFYATVRQSNTGAKVDLRHQSAFFSAIRRRTGNPCVRCFTMYFDSEGKVVKRLNWH